MAGTRWDALVVDEAHLSALAPERAAAVNWIARRSRRVVLVTATPHPGEPEAFDALCRIGRLAGEGPLVMFRRTRADLGVPVNRRTRVVLVTPSRVERRLHAALHRYCSRVWSARAAPDGVCADARLAMLVLTKRSASGTAPLLRSLERRFDLLARAGEAGATQLFLPLGEPDHEAADEEPATVLAAPGLESREAELCVLARLIDLARSAGPSDAKLRALARLLRRARQPAIVFTEYRDALTAVARQLPPALPVACVHGGMDRRERDEAIRAFTHGGARVLLATDAAAHGLNLQARCRLVINLDLPWNPVRLEQRIGRVDRIGQTRAVHAVHLVARGTSERRVLERLTTRSALARVALGGGANPAGIDPEAMVAARVFGRTSGPWCKSRRSTEGGDAPGRQGATTENVGQHSTEEQRRRAGCSVGRMPARPAPRAATGGGPRNDCRIAAIPMAPADWQAGPGGASPPFRRIDLAAAARQELARLGRLRLLRARGSRTLHDVAARLDAASPWWTTLRLPGRGCSRVVGLYLAEIVDGRGALHERLLIPVEGGVCLPVRPPLLSWEACAGAALQAARARIEAACNAIRPRLQAEQARERGLGDLVESVPVLSVQAGLFDRRADRQLSAGRGEVERLREETRNRVAALDRTADLQLVSPPRLVLVALVRGG